MLQGDNGLGAERPSRGILMDQSKKPSVVERVRRLWASEEGQTMGEYALLIALVSIGMVAVLTTTRNQIRSIFSTLASRLSAAVSGAAS